MKTLHEVLCFAAFIGSMAGFFTSCEKDDGDSSITISDVTGVAQKGPFINGSSITVYDLKSNLTPTGRSYNAQITDNKGTFDLSGISLTSHYADLRADGFYFNEVTGKQSVSQITLYAITDVSDKTNINVNLLTHLEKARVEYLVENGKSFSEAKSQAQKEILAIFNIDKSDLKPSESLNISESGDENAILLAISAILQGYRSESELTELLSGISNDIKEDGILNDNALGSELINHAVYLDTNAIKTNLAKRYSDIGSTASIPSFGKYLTHFISETNYEITNSLVTYPLEGDNGPNILSLTDSVYTTTSQYTTFSLAAEIPSGVPLKIKISSLNSSTTIIPAHDSITADTISSRAIWYYALGSSINWSITAFDETTLTQIFTAIESGKSCDLQMFFDKGSFLIEYYEMNSDVVTRRKKITVK
jgi:hypothetical protein